jgi:hypothetical protein
MTTDCDITRGRLLHLFKKRNTGQSDGLVPATGSGPLRGRM